MRGRELYEEVDWSREEVAAYFGKELAPPYIPSGLKASPYNGTGRVVFRKEDRTLVEDSVGLSYYHDIMRTAVRS